MDADSVHLLTWNTTPSDYYFLLHLCSILFPTVYGDEQASPKEKKLVSSHYTLWRFKYMW